MVIYITVLTYNTQKHYTHYHTFTCGAYKVHVIYFDNGGVTIRRK